MKDPRWQNYLLYVTTLKTKNQCTLSEQGITLETDVQVRKEASLISSTAYVYSVNCT